jgi:hypothetical protein
MTDPTWIECCESRYRFNPETKRWHSPHQAYHGKKMSRREYKEQLLFALQKEIEGGLVDLYEIDNSHEWIGAHCSAWVQRLRRIADEMEPVRQGWEEVGYRYPWR